MNTQQRAKAFLVRDSGAEDLEVTRTEGSYVFDARGRRHIDFLAGWCVGNLGWGNEEIRNRLRKVDWPTYVYPYYLYRPWVDLAELLAKLTPGRLKKCFRATGGSEAVEIALQVAMIHTQRRKFVSIEGCYHGNTLGGLSIGDAENRKTYPNLLAGCLQIAPPLNVDALSKLKRRLRARDVAAVIMEPVICNLGVLVPEQEFMTGLARLCKKYGTLLIMDEVATGFGRTGRLFATEHFGIEPDLLCMAKAITGGHAPMGAVIATPAVARSAERDGSFYSTYGWHPLAVEAALATLRFIDRHETKLLAHVNAISALFVERLAQMDFGRRAALRVKGLAIAVELKDATYAEKIATRCRKKGLLLTTQDKTLTLFPPLTIEREVASEGLRILSECT